MPFSDLPDDLQARFYKKKAMVVVNLKNYPLTSLSRLEFSALVYVLQENPHLVELNLSNCGLEHFPLDEIDELLTGLNHLVTIHLNNNELSFNDKTLRVVYRALSILPKLHFVSLHDKKELVRVPEFLSGLCDLPALRVFIHEKSNFISFLNGSEINALINFVENEPTLKNVYFSSPPPLGYLNKLSNYKALIRTHKNIKAFDTYRRLSSNELVSIPPSSATALQFFDTLQNNGVSLRYSISQEAFIFNLAQANAASCEKIAFLLLEGMPKGIKWVLELPSFQVGYFAIEAFNALKKKGKHITIVESKLCTLNNTLDIDKTNSDYLFLKSLNKLFALCNKPFYKLINDKQALFKVFERLKRMLNNDNEIIIQLIYQFFVIHNLCHIPGGIDSIEKLNEEPASNNSKLLR